MTATGRHAARDVLLLPAMSDRPDDGAANPASAGASPEVSRASLSRYDDGARLRVIVREAGLRDTFALSRFVPGYELDHPGSSRRDSEPARALMRRWVPFANSPPSVFVATSDSSRRILAYAQSRVVGPDQRWLLQSIGSNTGVYDPEPVVSELIRHVVQSAGLDGVKRIYARVEPEAPFNAPFRQNGFTPYSRERIMVADQVPAMASAPGVRLQDAADVWSIHQLYIQTTPREVQYAEALTSHNWEVDAIRRSTGHGCCGWLITDGYLAMGYIRAISRKDAHVIDFMISPEHREQFPVLVAAAFRHLASLPARTTWVVVRDYQSEFIPFLYELGFGIERAQEAQVRYTTAPVRSAIIPGMQVVKPVQEPAGRRVPTFFCGPVDPFKPATAREIARERNPWSCGATSHDE